MSYLIQNFDLIGIFIEVKIDKKTEFLSSYYKMISVIIKNKHIKPDKKSLFEQIISQNITEKTVPLLLSNFTKPRVNIDPKSKILLKAIANAKFEFFETFALNFKHAIYELISNSMEKNYLNKYVFKIIEKCLIKFTNIEKEFSNKLYKIAYNIINMFLSTENTKIRKIFRSSVRIIYTIFHKNGYSNIKVVKFFNKILFSVIKFSDETLKNKEVKKILQDFVEVNFLVLKKTGDLSEFYDLFYSLILNLNELKNSFLLQSFVDRYSDNFLNCIKELFKYEISLENENINELSYTKLLNSLFDLFYSDKANQNRKTNCIKIICCIVDNCNNETKILILEKISFSHLSFFMDISNYEYLKILLDCIYQYVNIPEIYEIFIKYLDILFHLCVNETGKLQDFVDIIEKKIYNKIKKTQLFFLFIKYSTNFINNLLEKNLLNTITANSLKLKELNFFLRTLAKCSCDLPNFMQDNTILQDILNIFISFLSIKILNFKEIDYSSKYKLKPTDDVSEFSIYLLILAQNLPCLVFNRNTSLTNPIKIELSLNILNKFNDKKIFLEDFKEFNDIIKKQNKELDSNSYIYLLGIYICFLSRFVILNIFFTQGFSQQKDILKTKIYIESLITEKASIINMIEYLKDNFFLYDNIMYENFMKIFEFFSEKYLDIMMKYYNTRYKQILLSNDLISLLNNSCFYHEKVRKISLDLIKVYSENFPFILNEYDIFEYYVNVLGKLILQTVSPYEYFIKIIKIDDIKGHYLELSSEQGTNEQILSKLSDFFEKGLQKSHIINNNNIVYNMANYINKYSLNALGNPDKDEMNYSINILQKIYNKIKKVEISSFLKTTAYLDPKKFENYLKENVYKNFDKYISISAIDDIHNLTDYAKSIILQVRNKYMGIIEGKINNLRVNYLNDNLFDNFKTLILGKNEKITDVFISSFTYYKIMNDINVKIQNIFQSDDIKTITDDIFPVLVELTSFIVYSGINEFKTIFNKNIILDEIINLITFIPILLANSSAIEAGSFCWEWILYFKKNNLASLMNNIILSVKCLRQHIEIYNNNYINKINIYLKNNSNGNNTNDKKLEELILKDINTKSEIFDVSNALGENIINNYINYETSTIDELNKKNANFFNSNLGKNNFKFISDNIFIIVREKIIKNFDLNDYINSQIILLKFIKECMNEICKCDIEKLYLIYDLMKLFVDLKIDINLYNQPLYIYLHFIILNISLELIDIIQDKLSIFQFKSEELSEFIILTFLYGFRYFEFDKQRRTIANKVLLSEIEQTLINCVEIIIKDKKKTKLFQRFKRDNAKKKYKKITEFVFSLSMNFSNNASKNDSSLEISENIKDLLVYLIESEINNLRYWNSPSTFHNIKKKYTPNSSKFKEEKIKDLFESASTISNKLTIKLTQRFPWIERKFGKYIEKLGNCINSNKKAFYQQNNALKYLIEYIFKNKLDDLNQLKMMKHLILWKYPSLNFALKYICYEYSGLKGLHKYCMNMLENAKNTAIIFYMPQLIQSLRTNSTNYVEKFIIKKSKESSRVAHQFLWSLEVEEFMGPKVKNRFLPKNFKDNVFEIAKIIRMKILKDFNPMQRKFWFDENLIFSNINEISAKFLHLDENTNLSLKMEKSEKTRFVREELQKLPKKIPNHIYLPTNPNFKITEILPNSASSLQSAKKVPFIVSFIGRTYEGPDSDYLVTNMNISEYAKTEIFDLKFLVNNLQTNNLNVNNPYVNSDNLNSRNLNYFVNKSTANTNIIFNNNNNNSDIYNENQVRFNTNVSVLEESLLENKNGLYNEDDDLIIYDEQDNFSADLNIPYLDVKIFGKHDEKEKSNRENENKIELNLDNLSNCTEDSVDEKAGKISDKLKYNNRIDSKINKNDFYKNNTENLENKKISCIFKVGDDLRQDSLALQVISIFKEIFKENNLNLFLYPYQTISTINSKYKDLGGFIECCQDCDSRDQIGKTFDTNLYDYFVCTFGQANSEEYRGARKNLIESLAGYAIISYILQIKDRHNGNILVDKYGHLIHIDFGFIFDISPAKNLGFENAAFKLTKEMIKIMDSIDSEPYALFVDLCIKAFLASRDYVDKLLDPVVLMFNSGLECFREGSIKNFLERFRLDLTEDEAAVYFRGLIKKSEDNWRTNFYDYIQNKQNKIHY